MSQAPEQEVVLQIQQGNAEMVDRLYLAYRADFVRWAEQHFSCPQAQALDVFQDAVIIFYRNIAQGKLIRLESSTKMYLFAIGKNVLRKQLQEEPQQMPADEKYCDSLDLRREYEESEQKQRLRQAFAQLTPTCRQLLETLYYRHPYGELSHEQKHCLQQLWHLW